MEIALSIVVDAALEQLDDLHEAIKQGHADRLAYRNLYESISQVSGHDGQTGEERGYLDGYDTPDEVDAAEAAVDAELSARFVPVLN